MNGRVLNFNLSHEFTIDQFLGRAKNLDRSGLFVGVDNLIDRTAIGSGIIVGGHGTLVVSGTARGQAEEKGSEGNWFNHNFFIILDVYKSMF